MSEAGQLAVCFLLDDPRDLQRLKEAQLLRGVANLMVLYPGGRDAAIVLTEEKERFAAFLETERISYTATKPFALERIEEYL